MLPKVYGIKENLLFALYHSDIIWAVDNHYISRLILFQHFRSTNFPIYFNGWVELSNKVAENYSIDTSRHPYYPPFLQEIAVDLRKLENYVWTSRT